MCVWFFFFLPGLNIQYPCCSLSASQWCHIPAVKIAWLWDDTARNWSCVFIRGRKMGAADRQCGTTKPPVDCGSATHIYKLNLGRGLLQLSRQQTGLQHETSKWWHTDKQSCQSWRIVAQYPFFFFFFNPSWIVEGRNCRLTFTSAIAAGASYPLTVTSDQLD